MAYHIALLCALAAFARAAGDTRLTGRWRRQAVTVPEPITSTSTPLPTTSDSTEIHTGTSLVGLVPGLEGGEEWRALWDGALEAINRMPTINDTEEVVVVQLGAVAHLHCPGRHLGERGVSWVRRRDWHIISAGLFMYTNDERFQVIHAEGSDDWTLQIKFVQQRDNGTYECQASAGRGILSRLVHLRVAEPEAFILGGGEHHVDRGSDISLVCIIEKSPEPPQYVFWYHNGRMINYDATRGVSVRTEPGAKTQSALLIRRAAPAHSGDYECRAANAQPAHIQVYVSEGSDKMAATLSRSSSATLTPALSTLACVATLTRTLLHRSLVCHWPIL